MQDWTRKKNQRIKKMNCKRNVSIEPLALFIGETGVGKSRLIKIICTFLIKTMHFYSGLLDKPKIFILAPTVVAVIKINETTINSGLSIPPYVNAYTLSRLSDS